MAKVTCNVYTDGLDEEFISHLQADYRRMYNRHLTKPDIFRKCMLYIRTHRNKKRITKQMIGNEKVSD